MIIEKNIPIPSGTGITGRRAKYPFGEMEVGDSLFIDNEPRGSQSGASMASKQHGARYGKKFTSRTEGNGVRIWRVE